MHEGNARTMQRYLAQLVAGGDFTDIAMRPDLRFTGPLAAASGAEEYREICRDVSRSVRGISVHAMVGDDHVIHLVYDVDLGLPGGPVRTAQTVELDDGALASVDVIFDAAQVAGIAS